MADLTALFNEFGQSIWLDNLSRAHLNDGSLNTRIAQGVRGLTSNPTIFARAIQGSADYDEQFGALMADDVAPVDAYWHMVIDDIQAACDAFAPLYNHQMRSMAMCRSKSLQSCHAIRTEHCWRHVNCMNVDRANVMIKIPATVEGLPAIQSMIAEGRSVNVTLIFSPERHQAVMEAYISGLEQLATDPDADPHGLPAWRVSSLAASTPRSTIGSVIAVMNSVGRRQLRRSPRLHQFFGCVFRTALGGACCSRRPGATTSVGIDRHEESGVL